MSKLPYNMTQLHPEQTFERHVFHRDQFAHFLRWTRVLNLAEIGMNILDVGCGSGNLLEVFYRNRFRPKRYLGIDVRKRTIERLDERWSGKVDFASFRVLDVVTDVPPRDDWDIIACFEVLEHIGKDRGSDFLGNVNRCMEEKTVFLLSTPVFDQKTGAAGNHIIEGQVGEWGFHELKSELERHFTIQDVHGTFASKRDVVPNLTPAQLEVYQQMGRYYDPNLMSVIFAPLHPEHSRNCIWTLGKGGRT